MKKEIKKGLVRTVFPTKTIHQSIEKTNDNDINAAIRLKNTDLRLKENRSKRVIRKPEILAAAPIAIEKIHTDLIADKSTIKLKSTDMRLKENRAKNISSEQKSLSKTDMRLKENRSQKIDNDPKPLVNLDMRLKENRSKKIIDNSRPIVNPDVITRKNFSHEQINFNRASKQSNLTVEQKKLHHSYLMKCKKLAERAADKGVGVGEYILQRLEVKARTRKMSLENYVISANILH